MNAGFDWMTEQNDPNSDEKSGRKIYGVVTGTVQPFIPDPLGLSRVRVSLPCIDSLDPIAWARVASPAAGLFQGNYFIPRPGDSVLVAFEHGDINAPYIIGSLWNNVARPPVPLAETQIRAMRTLTGNQIVFQEVPPTVTIQSAPTSPVPVPFPASPVGPHQTISLSPTGVDVQGTTVVLQSGDNKIYVTPAGIVLQSGASVLSVTKDGIQIASGASVRITGGANVQVLGAEVRINC